MKLFRTITLVGACLAFAGSALAQTTPTKPTTSAAKVVKIADLPAAVTDAVKAAYPTGTITKASSTGAAPLVYSVTVSTMTTPKTGKPVAKLATHKFTADGKAYPVKK